MKKKTEAALKAIGVFIAMNAVAVSLGFILRWLGIKPGVDLRPMPPGTLWLSEIFMLILAIQYTDIGLSTIRDKPRPNARFKEEDVQ